MKMGWPNGEMEIKEDDDDDRVVEMRLFHGLESCFGEGKMEKGARRMELLGSLECKTKIVKEKEQNRWLGLTYI